MKREHCSERQESLTTWLHGASLILWLCEACDLLSGRFPVNPDLHCCDFSPIMCAFSLCIEDLRSVAIKPGPFISCTFDFNYAMLEYCHSVFFFVVVLNTFLYIFSRLLSTNVPSSRLFSIKSEDIHGKLLQLFHAMFANALVILLFLQGSV